MLAARSPMLVPAPGWRVDEEARVPLRGGRAVRVRPIRVQDAGAEQAFVAGLSLESRHKRFHIGLRRLSSAMLREMVEVDQHRHVAFVAEELLADSGAAPAAAPRLVADARYVRSPQRPAEAEFAIAVADAWQGLGLGRALIARLLRHARREGVRTLVGDVLAENRRMIVLMQGLGAVARAHPDGPQLVRVVLDLDAPVMRRPPPDPV